MKMTNKKILISLLAIIGLIGVCYFLLEKPQNKINPKIKFEEIVNAREQRVWQALQTIGISKDIMDECYKKEIKEYQRYDKALAAKELPKNILTLIHKTMIDCNIDPQSVTIAVTNDDSHATATDSVLYINKKMF